MNPEEARRRPIWAYRQYGDAVPPTEVLKDIHASLQNIDSITALLVAADVSIDLAVADPHEASPDKWIVIASQCLDRVQSQGESARAQEDITAYKRYLPAMVRARLKQAELPNWQRAATQQNVTDSYQDFLAAACHVSDWLGIVDHTDSKVLEFLPILLGARGLHRGLRNGWFGRLALDREDVRVANAPHRNASWDMGISKTADPEDFKMPPMRVQIKRSELVMGKYALAGIVPMSAIAFGFDDAKRIISYCLFEEKGERLMHYPKRREYENRNILDNITARIGRRLEGPRYSLVSYASDGPPLYPIESYGPPMYAP